MRVIASCPLWVVLKALVSTPTQRTDQEPHCQGVARHSAQPANLQGGHQRHNRDEKPQRHDPRTACGRVWKVLQTASEKPQANRQERAQPQRLKQALLAGRVVAAVLHPGASDKQDNADGGRPKSARPSEEAVVHSTRDETDAGVFEQHHAVLLVK